MPDTLYADGFEDAFLGLGTQFNHEVAIYSTKICLMILMERDGMTLEEAHEYLDYNVTGAYVGETTPIFLLDHLLEELDPDE
jgi:hypothetical protein